MRHPVRLQRRPERQPVGRQTDDIAGDVFAGRGIETDAAVTLIEQRHFIAHHILARLLLQLFEAPL
jgi:hypothetical protein